jgi:thiol-disulfide isomerase/thioredoxin
MLLAMLICIMGCSRKSSKQEMLPSFDMLLADSLSHFNTSVINDGVPVALLYFSPDCEHCQKETESILHHINELKHVQFIFVTNDPFDRLKVFESIYNLTKYPNIKLGRDERFFLLKYFKGIFPPYLVLYDGNKAKKAVFQGEASADSIISTINSL